MNWTEIKDGCAMPDMWEDVLCRYECEPDERGWGIAYIGEDGVFIWHDDDLWANHHPTHWARVEMPGEEGERDAERENWLEFFGDLRKTIKGDLLKGWIDGGKFYLDAADCRDVARQFTAAGNDLATGNAQTLAEQARTAEPEESTETEVG